MTASPADPKLLKANIMQDIRLNFSHLNTNVANLHEFVQVSPRLAKVTASIPHDRMNREQLRAALQAKLPNGTSPVRGSFRYIDRDNRHAIVGYVYSSTPVMLMEEAQASSTMHRVNANVFMDKQDETYWQVKAGEAGGYLVRQGHADLRATLEQACVKPTGSAPRMSQIASVVADAEPHEVVAYVIEGVNSADTDAGICLETAANGDMIVMSLSNGETQTVQRGHIVEVYPMPPECRAIPVPADGVRRIIASREVAADRMDPKLTPKEYWTLAYPYPEASAYLAKLLQQVEEIGIA